MADRRDIDPTRDAHRVGGAPRRRGHPSRPHRAAHDSLIRRCAASGIRIVEGAAIVPFTPWTCVTCGCRDDLVVVGAIAFCQDCLDASPREDDDDVYQDTGGGD